MWELAELEEKSVEAAMTLLVEEVRQVLRNVKVDAQRALDWVPLCVTLLNTLFEVVPLLHGRATDCGKGVGLCHS